jgi:omega-amidase
MKISVIQQDIAWEDKTGNFRRLEKLIGSINGTPDICLLPEMFNTGFSVDPAGLSEPPNSITFNWMKQMAESRGGAICGSYIVHEKNKYYNRFVFVTPEGDSFIYDKRHLFSMGGEGKYFTPGKKRVIIDFRGVRIFPVVCYDLRFPVWSRNKNDYDLLLYSANWPVARHLVWVTLLKARAIENQCFVAGANRVGTDGTGAVYSGDSMVIDARGETISPPAGDKEGVISANISPEELSEFRSKFPFLRDEDQFSIKI